MTLPKLTPPDSATSRSFFLPILWGAQDPQKVAEHALAIAENVAGGVHFGDNFLTWGRNNSMLDDGPFVAAWRSNIDGNQVNEAIVWRRYILACAAYHAVQLDGDFVECGCHKGIGVKVVADYLGGKDFPKTFWAYDLFEYGPGEVHQRMHGLGPELFGEVQARFEGYRNVRVIKGRIPDVFGEHAPDRIAYLHLDLNQAPAEIAALDALFDRVVPGGIIIMDDYEWAGAYREQKLAEDPWFEARSYRVFPLPTGQGIVLKR